MLEGHSLVYFGPGPWDGLWRNRHQLLSVFARRNKVLYVEPRMHLRPAMRAVWRERSLGLGWPLCEEVRTNLFVFHTPRLAPVSGNRLVAALTWSVQCYLLRQTLRQLGMDEPIVWFSQPGMVDLPGMIRLPRLLVYHVVDEYSAYEGHTPASRRRLREREREMMSQVDTVIVVSQKLYEAKRPFNLNTYLVPNGVDYQAYAAALADPHLPDDLRVIKSPRLGYSGLIGDRLNLNMLKELARDNPEWSLVFIGEVRVSQQVATWQALLAMPNVHYLGLVEISQVPHYLKGLQVGLMPYVKSQESENISPLKLYDYLAAGLPVASTDIPAAREFSQYIHLADSPQNFTRAVRTALADTTPERRQVRCSIAAQHTWEVRVEQLSDIFQAQLAAKIRDRRSADD